MGSIRKANNNTGATATAKPIVEVNTPPPQDLKPQPPPPAGIFRTVGGKVYFCPPKAPQCLVGDRCDKGIRRTGEVSPSNCLQNISNIPATDKRILELVSKNEGNMDAINTYSNSDILSVGFLQCSIRWGKLQELLGCFSKSHPRDFDRCFRQQGVDVGHKGQFFLNGTKITKDNWDLVRTDRVAHIFAQAGLDLSFQQAQIDYACSELKKAKQDCPKFQTEVGQALYFDSYVNSGENASRLNYKRACGQSPASEPHLIALFCNQRIANTNKKYRNQIKSRIQKILEQSGNQGQEIKRLMTQL